MEYNKWQLNKEYSYQYSYKNNNIIEFEIGSDNLLIQPHITLEY